MRASATFVKALEGRRFAHIGCELLGSLAWTGAGHATDKAVILGLAGFEPDTIEPAIIDEIVEQARATRRLHVAGRDIAFNPAVAIVFDRKSRTPVHPNPPRLVASNETGHQVPPQRKEGHQ